MLCRGEARAAASRQRPRHHPRPGFVVRRHPIGPRPRPTGSRVPAPAAGPAGDPRPSSLSRTGPGGDRSHAADPGRDRPIAHALRTPGAPGRPRGRPPSSTRGGRVMSTMSADLERALDELLGPGPADRLPDGVLTATFERTVSTTQRRSIGVLKRSPTSMSPMLRLMAVGAVIALVVGGALVVGSQKNSVTPPVTQASPSPAFTAAPTPAATVAPTAT